MSIQYFIIDTESNGLSSTEHELNEISIIRTVDKVQLTKQIICEHPEKSSYDALRITGKSLADLQKGFPKEEVVGLVEKFFADSGGEANNRCIVAHNAQFDRKMLWALWAKCNKEFPAFYWLDTIHMTRNYAKKQQIIKPKVNLAAACDLLQIKKVAGVHNAKSDARNTFYLWQKLMSEVDHLEHIKLFKHELSPSKPEEDSMEDLF